MLSGLLTAVVVKSVAQGVADVAVREDVDLVVMNTRNRKGVAEFIGGGVVDGVRCGVSVDVRVLKAHGLAGGV